MTVDAARWRVDAYLAGTSTFTFVVKVAGQPDAYFGDIPSPFTIDPWRFGGKTVSLSVRAGGSVSNPWAPEVKAAIPPPKPVMSVAADRWHLTAYLPGTNVFTFVVKVAGKPDAYFGDIPSPFTIDRSRFGGRRVSVSVRAGGSVSNPWASEVNVDVPAIKLFGIVDAKGPQGTSTADAKNLGVTLDRIEFGYGTDVATMDIQIARDTSHGLTPLVLLNQYGTISRFDLPGWKSWASMVVARYGPGGSFWQGRTDGQYAPVYFEVLNEPYGWWFYTPQEPAAYASFFTEVVGTAKAANPGAKFLLAGYPHTYQNAQGAYSGQSWNAQVKAASQGQRAQQLADGVTVHPYGSLTAERGWRSAVATHNDFPQLPVWITEIGYKLGEVVDGVTVTRSTQAALMQRGLADFASWSWAQAYAWFKYADYDSRDGDHMWYGVVEPDGTHRPSYDVYRSFIASSA